MRLLWEDRAWEEYCQWQQEDKKTLRRINKLLQDIRRNCYEGIGQPELLRENLSGWWSRRIDETNRIVYKKIDEETIVISNCRTHYGER